MLATGVRMFGRRSTTTIVPSATTAVDYASLVEAIPINILIANTEFEIIVANKASRVQLKEIEHLLPIRVEELIGINIDRFHQDPERIRRLLLEPNALPHQNKIALGPETLHLRADRLCDSDGNTACYFVTWSLISDKEEMIQGLQQSATTLHQQSDALNDTIYVTSGSTNASQQAVQHMSSLADTTGQNISGVATAAEATVHYD